MKFWVVKGKTSKILTVFIQDSSSTTGAGLGSLDQTSSIVGGFVREGSTGVALVVDQNVTTEGTYEAPSTAGQVRIGTPANMRTGIYELHFHNDLFATGADAVTISLGGATNMADLMLEVQLSTLDPNTVMRGTDSALLAADINLTAGAVDDVTLVATTTTNSDMRGTDSALLAASINLTGGAVDTVTTLTNKTGFSLAATGLDAIVSTAIGMVEIAKAVWDRVLTGATHNIATSAGRRLRQLEASFVITTGTAQAGGANTITLAAGESTTDDIFQGDRVIIVAGTGTSEHGIIILYNGTTKVATMSQNWVITPDATSEYELSPADVDVETWQHVTVSTSSTTALPVVDAQSISDSTAAADAITEARLAELDAGNLPTDVAAVKSDTAEIGVAGLGLTDLGGMSAGMKAEVNAEVDTALVTTTYAEPAAVPAATASIEEKLSWLAVVARNKITQTATTQIVRNDADGADIGTSAVSDDGVTFIRGEYV